jgi:polyphosphate kinase
MPLRAVSRTTPISSLAGPRLLERLQFTHTEAGVLKDPGNQMASQWTHPQSLGVGRRFEGNGVARRPFDSERLFNRDLSWLDFNRRVLELASDDLPLLERVRLFAIVGSNLDEFFAVRMAALERMAGIAARQLPDGRLPAQVLRDARTAVVALQAAQDELWLSDLQTALTSEGIRIASVVELCKFHQLPRLRAIFRRDIEPLLTPIAVGPAASLPFPRSCALNVAAIVADRTRASQRLIHTSVPEGVPRFLEVHPGVWVALDDMIARFFPRLLGSGTVKATAAFRVTRDADLPLATDADDLVAAMDSALRERRQNAIVRLETNFGADPELVATLKREIGVSDEKVYTTRAPLALRDLFQLSDLDRPDLKNRPWRPVTPSAFSEANPRTLLDRIKRGPLLVHHPYQSFESSVVAFTSAARDDDVAALKATVYRTGDSSAVLASLSRAAAEGKSAVAFIELKARFDERRNLAWVRRLVDAGVNVVYGLPNLKVHAKLALLVRREPSGVRRYVHIGTGNYHASNAGSYEDLSLFSTDEAIAADVADLFNALTSQAPPTQFRKLLVGPWFLREGLLSEIGTVIRAVAAGRQGRIRIKVNSLVDPGIIDALYAASQAGATVEVVTRGICSLKPGLTGTSDRIRVFSVLGRFLEHSRIFLFEAGSNSSAWIGSADLMPRNLDARVEVLAPVESPQLRTELSSIVDALVNDTRFSWELDSKGAWHRRRPNQTGPAISAQELLMRRASREASSVVTDVTHHEPTRKESHVHQLVH